MYCTMLCNISMCIQCLFNVYSIYIQCIFNIHSMFSNIFIVCLNDSYRLTYSHIYILEMLSHLKMISFRNEPEFNQCEGRKVSRGDFRYNEYYLNVLKVLFRGGLCQGSIIKSKGNLWLLLW